MNILGIGIVFTGGCGIDAYENALIKGFNAEDNNLFVYSVDLDRIKDKNLWKKLRRADKFSKMAVLAAADAATNSAVLHMDKKRLGIIVSSAFGPQVTTFDFLDGLLDYGEVNVSPTVFSNSVHNAASSYIAGVLGVHGPCLTITQFYFSFQTALQMAGVWLDEERCDYCLVGAVDQYGEVLGYIQNHKLSLAEDGRIKPFNFKPTYQIPAEGSVFFLVSKNKTDNTFCKIESICFNKNNLDNNVDVDLNIIDADGAMADESAYLSAISPKIPTAAYAPLFGSMMIGSAFNCTAGALMLKNQAYYKNPVTDNPHGINLLQDQGSSSIERISCIRYNCNTENAIIHLKRA